MPFCLDIAWSGDRSKTYPFMYVDTDFLLLDQNSFSGPIPETLAELMNLRVIALDQNQLTGTIPVMFGSLSQLQTINLNDNELEGEVPSQLGNLFALQNLFLHTNELSGSMPLEICALRDLSLSQLTSDCLELQCEQPECCTLCF